MFWRKNKEAKILAELKKKFGVLVPEQVISVAFQGIDGEISDGLVDFVFLLIEENNAEQFRALVTKAIQIATEHKAIVVANAGGLIQLAAGPRTGDFENSAYRINLANDLVRFLGNAVRIVHGRTIAHIGIVGTELRKNWGVFPLDVGLILRTLLDASPGLPVYLETKNEKPGTDHN